MKRSIQKILGTAILAATIAVGCYAPTPSHPEYIDRLCGAQCDRRLACDPAFDRTSCVNRCRNFGSPRRIYDRGDVVEEEIACFNRLECPVAMDERASSKACVSTIKGSVKRTPVAVDYCRERVKKFDDCGFEASVDECLGGAGLYTDEVLHELGDCLTHTCKHFTRCFRAVLGVDEGAPQLRRK